ncbi:aldehyde dehydrogenase family protein [Aeromicrobium sp. 636]|uniref:Aldehyde dehydrogenase n=1 Tax=Aeromicrobium senzhongii TaxID=2663859 RepID=A0A8I0EXD9_9ACTN|nr:MULTISPECIES: aldehyde dehydrogenase family protein [Aeromicrobium]MBC9227344.1 aldehyde dehydrogenase family protein [Aeromicrobium senzhongii]MCQ3999442.1 aldehyde dehydrogenase family protein [Aeromicrobium sp. 636]MTB88246.1 aldehyde dehydrogenase family protein [Aeromicrobium senzhongii]QNL94768.1 aldehyde dehydrogenase family protein [Aeromicrobium senzhongii]
MTATIEPDVASSDEPQPTFDSFNPATGDVVGTHPIDGREQVEAAVAAAREATGWWQGLGFEGRKEYLLQWRSVLTRRLHQVADQVHREGGKPHGDALLEAGLAIDHIAWAAKHAPKVLGRKKVASGLLMTNQAASVEYQPLGVVGVIGPWNYPVFTPIGSIAYALAAGNTVVFKPSEYTPGVGRLLVDTFTEVVHGRPVLNLVTGLGETGSALCTADVDKIAFTGSSATGKKVMAACAENLTPVVIEAGGKDSMIIDEDADLASAAEAALWGGLSNAGQTCIGTERVYVHERVFDPFMAELLRQAEGLRPGYDDGGVYGPSTMPKQLDVIRSHIEDAIARGGRPVLGGADAVGERFVQPTILTHVPEDSLAVTEETFGPTLVVNPVKDMDEAVELTNATKYGLAGAVFGKKHAMDIASRIRSGMTSVNSVIAFAAVPGLPFGGVGDSGFGRIHGPDGLREFTYPKAITRQRMKPVIMLQSMARDEKTESRFAQLLTVLHGGTGTLPKRR